ncbi:MAG: translocation and assembly module TamA [Arenicella sp.]|jgi:translocation and assembly module TamA
MFVKIKKLLVIGVCLPLCLSGVYATAEAADSNAAIATKTSNPSRVELSFVGVDGDILVNIKQHVRLHQRLADPTPLSGGERRRLKRRIPNEIQEAIQPFGYYLATVTLIPAESVTKLIYKIELNQPVVINKLSLEINGSPKQKAHFQTWLVNYSLKVGQVLEQAKYEQDKKALLARALRLGYFDAELVRSEMVIDEARTGAGINLIFNTGERYSISQVNVDWQLSSATSTGFKKRLKQDLLDSYITIKSGDPFDSDALVKTQQSLLATPYFSTVSVQAGETSSASASLPVIIALSAKKRNAYSAEIGVGTDTGVRGGVGYENRRINSRGHNVSTRLGGSEIKRSVIVNYQVPQNRSAKDSLNFFAALEEELGDSRRFESTKIGSQRLRSWNDSLLTFGLSASRETFTRNTADSLTNTQQSENVNELFATEQTTDLLMPSVRWERTNADDDYFPTKGWSASVTVRGASKSVASDIDLVQVILDSKRLIPLGTGRVKFRFKLASSLIDEAIKLPESLGFLAGGDDSIRGYKYESVGVNRNGEVTVAKNLLVGSIEYEHPIKNDISLAAFFDAGDAFDSNADYKKGVGVGLRWRLPFGSMRLDAASALDRDGNPLRLHFSFGTDL